MVKVLNLDATYFSYLHIVGSCLSEQSDCLKDKLSSSVSLKSMAYWTSPITTLYKVIFLAMLCLSPSRRGNKASQHCRDKLGFLLLHVNSMKSSLAIYNSRLSKFMVWVDWGSLLDCAFSTGKTNMANYKNGHMRKTWCKIVHDQDHYD